MTIKLSIEELRHWFDAMCSDCARHNHCYGCDRCKVSEMYEERIMELKEELNKVKAS